jgi:hypothetical protein
MHSTRSAVDFPDATAELQALSRPHPRPGTGGTVWRAARRRSLRVAPRCAPVGRLAAVSRRHGRRHAWPHLGGIRSHGRLPGPVRASPAGWPIEVHAGSTLLEELRALGCLGLQALQSVKHRQMPSEELC